MSNTKHCPFCGEEININAIKCRYCMEFLPKEDKISDNTQQEQNVHNNDNKLSDMIKYDKKSLYGKHLVLLVIFLTMIVVTAFINYFWRFQVTEWIFTGLFAFSVPIIFIPTVITSLLGTILLYKLYGNSTKFNNFGKLILSIANATTCTQFLCYMATISIIPSIYNLIIMAMLIIVPNILALIIAFIFNKNTILTIKNIIKSHMSKKISYILLAAIVISAIIAGIAKINEAISLPKCDSKYAEEQVVDIFKQHNYSYKELSKAGFVESIYLMMPQPISYDKSINKYTCKAKIVMKAVDVGFNPTIYRGRWISEHERYDKAYCWSTYYIYKEHGKNRVVAEYCNGNVDFEDYFYR